MSSTFDIGCLTCQVKLWIGQRDYLYSAPPHLEALARFLLAHAGHSLTVATDQMTELETCRELDTREVTSVHS